jgi:hypothetical protein
MQAVTGASFGPLIAYLVPGVTVLLGLKRFSSTLNHWFAYAPGQAPTIGGFLYLTVAALAAGMLVSAVRWTLVDRLHAVTGLEPPQLDFGRLPGRVDAFNLLIEIHYRHYQFYANMLVAVAFAYACQRLSATAPPAPGWIDFFVVGIEVVLYITSRDTLRKYHTRTNQLLSPARNADAAIDR